MGDIADSLIEDGETAWFLHLAGECDWNCQYCAEEIEEEEEERN